MNLLQRLGGWLNDWSHRNRKEVKAMGMKYMGYAVNYTEIHVGVVGDGVTKTVTFDIMAAPFALAYPAKNFPTSAKVQVQDGDPPQSVTINPPTGGGSCPVTLTFAKAPPAPPAGMLSPRTQMILWLVYG